MRLLSSCLVAIQCLCSSGSGVVSVVVAVVAVAVAVVVVAVVVVSTVPGRQHLRSASRRQLIVPRVRRSTFGARAFAIAGPTVWNSLPDSLRDPAVGPDQFRRDLKTHLFE